MKEQTIIVQEFMAGVVIITNGYSHIGERADYKLVEKYNNKARKMWDESKDYYKTGKQVHKLLLKFIEEVKVLQRLH